MGRYLTWAVLFYLGKFSLQGLVSADDPTASIQIMKERMKDYDKNIFPRCETSETSPVDVSLDMAIRQILDLSEQQQLLEASTWMRWKWQDCRLRGVVPDVNHTNYISVAASNIWMPDITLYEHIGTPLHTMNDYPAKVYWDGTVTYNFPAVIKIVCKIQMQNFPFDKQECDLTFGSWMYLVNELNVTAKNSQGDRQYYVHNGEWDLNGFPVERHELHYAGFEEPFVDVTFTLVLQRRPTYYIFNIIFPTFLVGLVSVLSFSLPPATGEKVSLSVTSLLTQTVFMLMLSQEMPSTSESIPLIQRYFAAILCIVATSTIMTILVLNLHYRGEYGRPVPGYLKTLLLNTCLRKLCQLPGSSDKDASALRKLTMRKPEVAYINGNGEKAQNLTNINGYQNNTLPQGFNGHSYTDNNIPPETNPTKEESVSAKVSELVTHLCNKQLEKGKLKAIIKEWEDLASVVDRIFLILCFTSLVVTTAVILFA